MISRPGKLVLAFFLATVGGLFALAGPYDMIHRGPFGWHIRQPAFWQGGIELIVLAAMIGIALYALQGWYRILVALILVELYARRQGVDLAILISLFYYEGIAGLGTLILNRVGRLKPSGTEKCLFGIVLGTLTWCCVEWVLSAAGPGSVRDLQIAAVIVLGGSLLMIRRMPVLGCVFSHVGKRNLWGALLGTFTCTIVLMLFAKASVSIDYDSLWYGTRGDRVLVAAGSVFKGLGLVGPVHYGPQAYELLLVPLSELGSVTAILGFSVWCWISLGVCLYSILEHLHWPLKVRLLVVALALATPAVMNIAITAKGDVMAATWVFFATYCIVRYSSTGCRDWLWVAFFSAAVATTFRMSALVYAGLTGLYALFFLAVHVRRRGDGTRNNAEIRTGLWLWLILGSCALFALVTARTVLLTGIPFSEVSTLAKLAGRMGFHLRFPVGGPAPVYPTINKDLASLIAAIIFRPAKLPHIIITWTGAAFAYFLLVGLILRSGYTKSTSIFWLLAITFPLLLLFVRFPIPGGDGNYFIVPILSMVIVGVGLVGRVLCKKDVVGRTLSWVAGLFAISAVAVSLATGSWGPGTRGWDFDFSRTPLDYQERTDYGIHTAKLQLIDGYLKKLPSATRVVGIVPINGRNPLPGSWLPVRYESLPNIWSAQPGYLRSPDAISAFLRLDHIEYVLVPRTVVQDDGIVYWLTHVVDTTMQNLSVRGIAVPVVYNNNYILWKLKD